MPCLAALSLALAAGAAQAQEVKVGLVLPYSGVGAELAQPIDRGVELYLKTHADEIKPYKINADQARLQGRQRRRRAKIVVQELLTQDNVDVLSGWVYSPNAIATAPIVTAGKKLAVLMNAGTAHITNMSPYYVRTSFSMWHAGYALGEAAAKQLGAKTAVVGYTTSRPARTASRPSRCAFEASGGKVIDEIPMGGANAVPDFTPFFQRAKDKKPDVFFVFVPGGDHSTAVVRTYNALGMKEAGIKLIGPGDITQDSKLQPMGQRRRRPHHHAPLQCRPRQSREQEVRRGRGRRTTARIRRRTSWRSPAMTAWRRSSHAIKATDGKLDGDKARRGSLKGWKYAQPARSDLGSIRPPATSS